jgi:hypothetical protein
MEEKVIGGKSVYQRNSYTSKSKTSRGRSLIGWLGLSAYRLAIAAFALIAVMPLFSVFIIAWLIGKETILGYRIRPHQYTEEEIEEAMQGFEEEVASEWLDLSDEGAEVPIMDFGVDNYGNLLISSRDSDEWMQVGRDM